MNFFQAQDNARRATRWLVVVYVLATVLIVAGVTAVVAAAFYSNGRVPEPGVLIVTAALAALLIVGATVYKTARLASGGSQVARDLGGTRVSPDTTDPLRQRLRNVVEEMAIASGVPVPEIYVLEQEAGINAFAAGFGPGDAAVAVTRGTLEILNRDELQGVIAHEFSHVLNGDMRLNIRMMGVLFGIMVLGLLGRLILRGGYHGSVMSSRRGRGNGAMLIGLGLVVLGAIGVFFARLIKAAVSRQREFLADASAVQFTRQTDGIADALKKIAGYRQESLLKATDPEEVSHMLFARGARFSSLFATHPPLLARIQALQPGFKPGDLPVVELPPVPGTGDGGDDRTAGFSGNAAVSANESIPDSIGNPTLQHVLYAGALRLDLPPSLYDAAHAPGNAWLLALTLFIDTRETQARQAFEFLGKQLGQERAALVRRYHADLLKGGAAWRLPLLEIAFPALRQTPAERLEYLLDLGERLIQLDNDVELHEFCLFRILKLNIGDAQAPSLARPASASKRQARDAGITLLAIIAERGNRDHDARIAAFNAGLAVFGDWAHETPFDPPGDVVKAMDRSLDVLQRVNNAARRSMVEAVAAAISTDRRLSCSEAELLRAICASLDCPLPPLAVEHGPPTP